jgi:hypothetical protein
MSRKKTKPVEDQTTLGKSVAKPATAQELVAALRESGFIGMWKDRSDIDNSREFARKLRERASTRNAQ